MQRFVLTISSFAAGLICMDNFGWLGLIGGAAGAWFLLANLRDIFETILEGAVISLGIILQDVIAPLLPVIMIVLFVWLQYFYEWPK